MTANIGWATFLIFACANALFIPVICESPRPSPSNLSPAARRR